MSLKPAAAHTLYHQAGKVGSGTTGWLNLRSYPAVLVFTAYGIGLTKAARWSLLLKLFSATLASEYREPQAIVSMLFLWSWKGGDQETWRQLEGFDRHKTPLSDHLLEVMERWRKSFVSGDANFELLFERFELMGSLAAFHENDEGELEKAAETSAARNDVLAWMPVGRSGWHSSTAQILLQELESGAHGAELLGSGFAKGSRRMLDLFIQNFKIFARRASW